MRYSRIRRARNQRRYFHDHYNFNFGRYLFFTAGTMGKYISGFIAPILKSKEAGQLVQNDPDDRR